MTNPLNGPLEAALQRTCQLDALGIPEDALARAIALARLLPQPSEGGLRAWFDRALAVIARPTFDEAAHALEGVRRLSGPRARGWQGTHVQVELEMEAADAAKAPGRVLLRGQVLGLDGKPLGPCTIAAVDRDGALLASHQSDRDGYFAFDVSDRVQHLAIAAPSEVVVLDDVLGPPSGDAGSRSREG